MGGQTDEPRFRRVRRHPVATGATLVATAAAGALLLVVATSGSSAPRQALTIAASRSTAGALVFVAAERGFFADEGLDVTLQENSSGKLALDSMLAGRADLATVGDAPFLLAALRGAKIAIAATIAESESDADVVARTDRGIESPRDLRGKRVGVTSGTTSDFFLDALLTINLLPHGAVHRVEVAPEEMMAALERGTVDAVSTWQPHVTEIQHALGARALTFTGGGIYTETFDLVGRTPYLTAHDDVLRRAMRALLRAESFARDHPAAATALVAPHAGSTPGVVAEVLRGYRLRVSLREPLVLTLDRVMRWALQRRLVDGARAVDTDRLLFPGPLTAVEPLAVKLVG